MRRIVTVLAMAAALLAWGSGAWAGIQHTVHNLMPNSNDVRRYVASITGAGNGSWAIQTLTDSMTDNGKTNEICIYCHTPHQSDTSLSTQGVPIWNRNMASQATTYNMYDSPTYDATTDITPSGVSKACLSCHDGTVGINQLMNNRGSGLGTNPSNDAAGEKITNAPGGNKRKSETPNISGNEGDVPYLGTDLRDDHPISMDYLSARSPNGSYTDYTGSGNTDAPGAGYSGFYRPGVDENPDATIRGAGLGSGDRYGNGIRLYNGKVQCASHHDPHNSGNPTFLRISNENSAVCRTCHKKDN